MNIQLIRLEQLPDFVSKEVVRPSKAIDIDYIGIAIQEGEQYYYWAKGISLEITELEYHSIKANPKVYYFSTALKLHLRIIREIEKASN